jgi:hypothetical protein
MLQHHSISLCNVGAEMLLSVHGLVEQSREMMRGLTRIVTALSCVANDGLIPFKFDMKGLLLLVVAPAFVGSHGGTVCA